MEAVAIIPWPDGEGMRDEARALGRPRLLVIADDAPPPIVLDSLEDWVRASARPEDRAARLALLEARGVRAQRIVPELDPDGVLHFGDRWAPLPPLEARIVEAMLAKFGKVVSRRELTKAGWPEANPGRNSLDVHVLRLRRRLEPIELAIRTVRARGYVLEPAIP